jgi:serine/threonine protein kinase
MVPQMMHQLALRLRDLHELGYVHRDLKPGNVMWLPRENRWTLIDFGCAARTGEDARFGFSLAYAAPEVIAAYRSGATTMVVQVLIQDQFCMHACML